jgi:hypothetical protein
MVLVLILLLRIMTLMLLTMLMMATMMIPLLVTLLFYLWWCVKLARDMRVEEERAADLKSRGCSMSLGG